MCDAAVATVHKNTHLHGTRSSVMPGNNSKTKETILSDTLNVLVKTLLLGVQIKPLPVCFCCLFVVVFFLASSILELIGAYGIRVNVLLPSKGCNSSFWWPLTS